MWNGRPRTDAALSLLMTRWLVASALMTAIAYRALAAQPPAAVPSPPDQVVSINGVRLQYVDWGGSGDAVLLLPGLGDDVHRFDPFAPRFTDAFHVVGFSRRGQGASDASSPAKY